MAYAEKRGKGPYPWRVKFQVPGGWDSQSGFRTKDDALEYGRAQETDVARGVFIDPRKGETTLGAFAELWMKTIDVAPLSMRAYRSRLNSRILPTWGDTELGTITGMGIKAWIKELKDAGLSDQYIADILMLMRMMLDDAVADRLIAFNPTPRAGRRGRYSKNEKPERTWATDRQVIALAENGRTVWGLTGYVLVLTLAYTGMRINEAAGLERCRCHLLGKKHEQWIDVSRQAQYVDGEYTLTDCKYGSARPIVIPPFLKDLLAQQLASHDSRWVFTGPKGSQMRIGGNWYEQFWEPITAGREAKPSSRGHKARPEVIAVPGLENLDPHGLRHGHNVWLDEDFQHDHIAIEARMGHAVKGIKKVYSHVSPEMTRRISEALQARWERSLLPADENDQAATGS
jgi:integrase